MSSDVSATLITPDPGAIEVQALLQAAEAKYQSRRREKFFGSVPVLLAGVPVWTESLAQRALQANHTLAVPSSFAPYVASGLVQELKSPLREEQTPQLIRFVMPMQLRIEVLTLNSGELSDRLIVWHMIREIADVLSTLSTLPGDPEETREWATLMAGVENTRQLADRLDAAIRNAHTSTEIYRLLEVIHQFEPLVWQFDDSLDVTLLRAARRLELLRRNDDDRAHLRNFLARAEQLAALESLIGRDDEHWGLHFVGAGGVGKTMLLRHICTGYSIGRFAVSRIDFDYLNPDYPRLAPGLLLWAFGEDLRAYARDSSFDEWMDQANGILTKLHEELRANLSSATGAIVQHPAFQEALRYYTQALSTLSLRVLLILDTCEELARVRPDGSVPDSVRDTFQILEALHARLPGLRVIFCGRRPLARSGYGWSCPSAPQELPARQALRLHEIRGFTHAEAASYLTGAKVSAGLHAPIISRCADVGPVVQVNWDNPAFAPADVPRCSPYDLKLYSEWAREEPPPDANTIATSSAAQYVEFRILRRLRHPQLEQLLPVIAILGHIDDDTLRHLSGLDHEPDSFEHLQLALRQQEWTNVRSLTDVEDSEVRHVYSVDPALRKRLRSYALEHQAGWRQLTRRAAQYLTENTITRDLSKLDWTDFEATLNVLDIEADAQQAAAWWERVVLRLRERDPQWRVDLLKFLCVSQETAQPSAKLDVEPNVQPNSQPNAHPPPPTRLTPTQRLRPAILAVYADALAQSGRGSHSDGDLWREVLDTASRYPTVEGAARLRIRATAGLLSLSEPLPDLRSLRALEAALLAAPDKMDQVTALALVKVVEATLDRMDLAELNGPQCDPDLNQMMARVVTVLCSFFVAPEESGLPPRREHSAFDDATTWTRCLRARAFIRIGEVDAALRDFDLALRRAQAGREINQLVDQALQQESLWVSILLEYARVASPAIVPSSIAADQISDRFPDLLTCATKPMAPLSLERLAAAHLRLLASIRPLDTLSDVRDLELALRVEPRMGNTAAQRIVPPLCCVAAEELAATGRVDPAVQQLRNVLNRSPPLHEEVRRDIERTYLRICLRFRLFDLSEGSVDSLQSSLRPADWELRFLAVALTPGARQITVPATLALAPDPMAIHLHAQWRAFPPHNFADSPSDLAVSLRTWLTALKVRPDADSLLDLFECLRLAAPTLDSTLCSEIGQSIRDGQSRSPAETALLTGTALLRKFRRHLLEDSITQVHATGEEMAARLGKRRAAEWVLEEATALALRLPDLARTAANFALVWFVEVEDCVGTLRAALTIALAREPSALKDMLPVYEFFRNDWRKTAPDYAGLGEEGAAVLALVENLTLLKSLNRLYQPDQPVASRWKPLLFRWLLVRSAVASESQLAAGPYITASSKVHPQVARVLEGIEFRHWAPTPTVKPDSPTPASRSLLSILTQPWVIGPLVIAAAAVWFFHPHHASVATGLHPNPANTVTQSLQDTTSDGKTILWTLGGLTVAAAFLWRQWFVPRRIRHICRAWTGLLLTSACVLSAFGVFDSDTLIVSSITLLLTAPYGLWRLVRYVSIGRALAKPILVLVMEGRHSTQQHLAVIGRSALSVSLATLGSILLPKSWRTANDGRINGLIKQAEVTQSYQEFARSLQPDLSPLFSRMRRLLGLRRAVFDLVCDTPETHAWPLEAAFFLNTRLRLDTESPPSSDPNSTSVPIPSPTPVPTPLPTREWASTLPSVRATPFRFRRSISTPTLQRKRGYHPRWKLRGSSVEVYPQRGIPIDAQTQRWHRRSFDIETEPSRATRILHLVGTPQDDSSGLSFRLLAERAHGAARGADYAESSPTRLGTAIRCEQILDAYPQLDLCILQRTPLTARGRRNEIDRREAALMRILAARLFTQGVPLVVTLPSVDHTRATAITDLIARYAARGGRPDGNAFLQMLDDVRHSIAKAFPNVLELSTPDLLNPQKVAEWLRERPLAKMAAAFTPVGQTELSHWMTLPIESLTGLLLNELNPILRQQELTALLPLQTRARLLYPQLFRPWVSRFERNRIALTDIFPGCFTDGRQVARADAWETTLDVCGFCALSNPRSDLKGLE